MTASCRFLHAADLHLDSPFRGMAGVPSPVREVIQRSTFVALDRLVGLAISERVSFVVLAGDVYDLEDRSARAQLKFQQAAEQLADAGIFVYIAHGNHDPLSGKRMGWAPPPGVHVFGAEQPETHAVVDERGRTIAHVHGISFAAPVVSDNLAERFQLRDPDVFNIAVLHTNVEGVAGHAPYAPASRAQLIASGMDYWALGHIHTRSILHETPHIVYPGNTQGRSIRETGARGCYIVSVADGNSVHMQFHETSAVRWETVHVNISAATTEADVRESARRELDAVRDRSGGRPSVVRLIVSGRSMLHRSMQSSGLLDELCAEWNEEEGRRAALEPDYRFVWVESGKLQTSGWIDKAELIGQDSFIGDLLRIASQIGEDDAALAAYVEEASSDLLRSRAGKYLRLGASGWQAQASQLAYRLQSGDTQSAALEEWTEWLAHAEDWLLDQLAERSGNG